MGTGKMNTEKKKKTTKVRSRENDPKHSLTEIFTERLIGLNKELMEISVCESTRGLNIEQRSK